MQKGIPVESEFPFDYKENHTLCVWSKKTFRDGEKKTSNDIIKVAGNRKNYNQRRTLNER